MIDDFDCFAKFLKAYQHKIQGKVLSVGDVQYKIQNDPLNLIFQWDSCFGGVVIPDKTADISVVMSTLKRLCTELNQQKDSS